MTAILEVFSVTYRGNHGCSRFGTYAANRGDALTGCAFRRSRPWIPSEGGHAFRSKPAGDSDGSRPPMGASSSVSNFINSFGWLGVKFLTLGGYFAQALTFEVEAVSVVHQAI